MTAGTDESVRHRVLLVGWDGVRDDTARGLQLPALGGLAAAGRWWTTTLPDVDVAPTWTAVGWSTILTGVGPDEHGVMGNDAELNRLHRYPEVLTTAYCERPTLNTYGAASALIFGTAHGPGPLFGPGVRTVDWVDRREYPGKFTETDLVIQEAAERQLREHDPDLAFVYLGEADQIAHEIGTGDEYEAAIRRQDGRLGRLIAAVRGRPRFAQENWLVMVTTDHGHRDGGGHGGGTWQERQSFVVAGLITDDPVAPPAAWADHAENVDIAPTILSHLGIPLPSRFRGGVCASHDRVLHRLHLDRGGAAVRGVPVVLADRRRAPDAPEECRIPHPCPRRTRRLRLHPGVGVRVR
ncbi:alkaline phosphatase family protein [Microbacterium sp. KUDC0406]|uniref:alkaline phosphatase family protein n=1 Tax=Microbacterium sp. KUDC0406 TaxID=2909588 RepID=UPI001F1A01C3|nr:alkaline phosphatase family protein [Microbacterium sp. KUDC0406]UJP09594.1 alkaline phosphatase family protein [Microbacterium sp. KUDC0406]